MTRHRDPVKFLTAEWRHLAMINHECPPELLRPFVPKGIALDDHLGRHYVSLVGFRFMRTRVMGVPVPFHRNFEELNLRFYVKRETPDGTRRGVVFIKEIVPRLAIAAVARTVYNENYVALPMSHRIETAHGAIVPGSRLEYGWKFAGRDNRLCCEISGEAEDAPADSVAGFISEHYWGYARRRDGGTTEYRVEHPKWRIHTVKSHEVTGDLTGLYGTGFGDVLGKPAVAAFVAEGSPVIVRKGVPLLSTCEPVRV